MSGMSQVQQRWFGVRVFAGEDLGEWALQAVSVAQHLPVYDGDQQRRGWIVEWARWYIPSRRALVCLTRDNLVKLGWWKNIDFENCLHLSVSFRDPKTSERIEWDRKAAKEIVGSIFGPHLHGQLWWEPAYSDAGKLHGVEHWRLFYTPDWSEPIAPKGEPYTLNPGRWRRWTEYQEAQPTPHLNQDITDELPRRREGEGTTP